MPDEMPLDTMIQAQLAARWFVLQRATSAQLVSRDSGHLVGRSMSVFLNGDRSVDLVQRRQHGRPGRWRRDPHTVVIWMGEPAADASNDKPNIVWRAAGQRSAAARLFSQSRPGGSTVGISSSNTSPDSPGHRGTRAGSARISPASTWCPTRSG